MKTNEIIARDIKANQQWMRYAAPGVPFELADSIETALSEAGLVIVPREPEPGIVLAGARSIGESMKEANHNVRSLKCWQAMISAHEKEISAAEELG